MRTHKTNIYGGKALVAGFAMLGLSSIQLIGQTAIGFNVSSFTVTDYDLAPTDSVGVISTTNWNNLAWGSGGTSPTFSGLVDSNGDVVADMTTYVGGSDFNYPNNTPLDGSVTLPDARMMAFARGSSSNGRGRTFTVENVPYDVYDVYVYFGGAGGSANLPYNMPAKIQEDVEGTWTDVTPTYIMTDANRLWSGTYTQSTSTIAGTDANYVLFENVTLDTFRIASGGVNRRAGYSGFQIVAVPEPGHYALGFALFTGLVLIMRRKRTA